MQQQQLSHPSGSVLLHLDDGASCPQGIVPSQMPPPPDDELHTRLELTLRDMESAYLLASRWLHTSQATALQMGLHTSFYKRAGVMCAPDLEDPVSSENLLLHLVHMRVSMLSVLEARLHNGDQEVRGKLHMLRRTWKQDKHAVDGYMQHLATSTEQLAKQVQHWREQHDTLCSWAQQAHNSDQNQVPREYAQRAAHMLDSVRGMPEPPFVHSFRAREPFPLCDRNMRQHVQYQRKLYWHQAPAQYLLEHTKTHGEHVLVDFRKTMQVFQEHHCMLAEEGWVPQHDLDSLGPLERMRQFVSQNTRSAKQEAMQAQEQAKQARKRKPATYAERVAEQQQHESQRQHSNRLHEALEHAYKPADLQRRNMLLRRRIETPDGYSVLRALVHRVRWAQHQMKQEQETIEALERQLKQLVQPSLPPECHVDDTPLPTGDYDPARDDDGRAAYEQRMYRAVEHLLREAQKRQPSSAQEEQLREQLRQSLDTLHHWKRFLYSHLGLCDVILCLEDPSDAVLMRQDEAMQEPSLLHQHYPYDELGLGEELLRSVQSFVMPVELVYGSDHAGWPAQDPRHDWHAMLKKVFPKACSDRDFAVKNDEICRKNAVYCDFVIESLQASLMGIYKHCRNPAPFDVAIMLHRCFSLARHWKPAQEVMLEVFVTHEELVINAIRENIAWQFRHDQAIWMIDNNWVMGCMHVVRGLFNKQRNLHGIHEAIVGLYGKHEFAPTAMQVVVMATQQQPQEDPESGPGVYRTSNNNFLRFICDVFRYLDLKRILGSIWRSQQQGQPGTVCQLSPCASQMVSWMVETKQPGTPVQTRWLRELSVSEQGIQCIEQVYDQFVRRANERDVAQVLEGLSRVDYQLCAQFFYTLQRHYACRHLALDADLTAQQVRVRRRIYQVPPEQPHLDRHLSLAFYCNTMACNELKHTVVQDRGNAKFYGTKQLLYDAQRDAFFCASKKTVGMRQRNKQKIRAYTGSEPEFIARAKAGELEAFCLVYTSMDDLFSGASNIEAPSSAPAAGNGKANTGVHITVDGKRLRIDTIDEPAPARVATTRIVQLRNRIDRYRALLKKLNVPVTDGDLDSLMEPKTDTLAPEQREEVKLALDQLIAEGKKEAKAIYKMIYHRPCYHMPAFSTPLVGYVICKEKQKDKQKTKSSTQPITVCTQCGSVTHFSLAEQYSTNGLTCGVCDVKERMLLRQSRCFCCQSSAGLPKPPVTSGGLRKDPPPALTFYGVRLLDDGLTGTQQYQEFACCSKCWRPWMGMPTTQVTYVRKAEGECRFLTRQEMLHVRSLPELRYGPGKFYDYALNFVGPAVDPEKLDRLQRIAAGLTIAQWEARK